MAKNSKVLSSASAITISTVGAALLHHIEPVIKCLDQYAPTGDQDQGHELPSRKDGLLRILLNNFCRDVYQQIHGVNTENYKFGGVKDNWDRAQNAVAQLVARYANNPEDMDADPNCARFSAWYEQANAKMEMLTSLLNDFQDIYRQVTGEDWKYVQPGTTVKTKIAPAEAAAKLRAIAGKAATGTAAA